MIHRSKSPACALFTCALALLSPAVASAANVARVGAAAGCNYPTVAAAVAAAAAGQTVFVAPGTHPANLGTITTNNLTIRSADATCHAAAGTSAILDAGGAARIALLAANVSLTFKDLSLVNGKEANGGLVFVSPGGKVTLDNALLFGGVGTLGGGCVFLSSGTMEMINNSRLTFCSTTGVANGGAVAMHGGAGHLIMRGTSYIGTAFFGNLSAGNGGGVYMDLGTLEMFDDTRISENVAGGDGGGVYGAGATIALKDRAAIGDSATSLGNRAVDGGGVYLGEGSSLTLDGDSGIGANDAEGEGGGVLLDGGSQLVGAMGSTIEGNHAASAGGGIKANTGTVVTFPGLLSANDAPRGGGMYAWGATATLVGTRITGNTATASDGGGLYLDGSTMTGTNVVLDANSAHGWGGGIAATLSTLTLDGSCAASGLPANTYCAEVRDNTASWGGGLAVYDGSSATIRRVAFLSNDATSSGSAIYLWRGIGAGSLAHVENALFTGNSLTHAQPVVRADSGTTLEAEHVTFADDGGVPAQYSAGSAGYLRRSIVWDALAIVIDPAITLPSACTDFRVAVPVNTSGANRISADPLFTITARGAYHPNPASSPAVDVCPAGLAVDLDGSLRPFGPARDMGAFEAGAPVP